MHDTFVLIPQLENADNLLSNIYVGIVSKRIPMAIGTLCP